MGKVHADMSRSLDGFVAGDHAGPQNALGDGGHRIQRWLSDLESWRERQSREGGQSSQDDEVFKERSSGNGAYVMGKRMFDEGEVGWGDPLIPPAFHKTRIDGSSPISGRLRRSRPLAR
jgi:dihydrofolate reductase